MDKRLRGVDVYAGDGAIRWPRVKGAGYDFAFVKATQGITLQDKRWSANVLGAQQAGLVVGSYHFFEPTGDATAQAKAFLAKVGGHENLVGQLRPVLDAEKRGGMTVRQYTDSVKAFIHVIETEVGVTPILYLSRDYATRQVYGAELVACRLWLAQWQQATPKWPIGPWVTWTFWQDSAYATVAGMPNVGGVDTDVFAGGPDELQKLIVR